MRELAGQTGLFPPEPAPDPLLCWLWLAHVLGPASIHAGRVLDAFGGAQETWEARDTAEFRAAASPGMLPRFAHSSWTRSSITHWSCGAMTSVCAS